MNSPLFAVTGITGQVGGAVARNLLEQGCAVRAVMRDPRKAKAWADLNCEIAIAGMDDAAMLSKAFRGADGVFVLLPPNFDPDPEFSDARRLIAAVHAALLDARPARVVALSTIGAHVERPTILTALHLMERSLRDLPLSTTALRAGWFMENSQWDIPAARDEGVVRSFLQPLEKPVPMVATADVGRVAAGLIRRPEGPPFVELEGPHRVTPLEIAASFAKILKRDVAASEVRRSTWEDLFRTQGAQHPELRARMLDGFNEGWIEFEQDQSRVLKGTTEMEAVLSTLIGRSEPS